MASGSAGVDGPVVVLGAGHAGVRVATALRELGHAGAVTVLSDESVLPYERPVLSKQFLADSRPLSSHHLRPAGFYHARSLDLRLGEAAVDLHLDRQRVLTATGREIPFARLVLATGARARTLRIPGMQLHGVRTLRSAADAEAVRRDLHAASAIVVIGGGLIGLEVAACAVGLGKSVAIVENQHRLMVRVLSPPVASYLERLHRDRGVSICTGVSVRELVGADGRISAVKLADGNSIAADLVLVSVGGAPETCLAERAGLRVADGVIVDDRLRADGDRLYAIGDCARYPSPAGAGDTVRWETVQNATEQARYVAAALVRGVSVRFAAVPWAWTEQYGIRIQMAGHGVDDDQHVVCGSLGGGADASGHVLRFRGDDLVAVDSVNDPRAHLAARRLLAGKRPVSYRQLAAAGFKLRSLLGQVEP